MNKLVILFVLALMNVSSICFADTYVNGYQCRNGTYVQGYHRADSNGTTSDNYNHEGNVNPYTGARGHNRN